MPLSTHRALLTGFEPVEAEARSIAVLNEAIVITRFGMRDFGLGC